MRIVNNRVTEALKNEYFDHHTCMHLARERLLIAGQKPIPLILPHASCAHCADDMIQAGEPGSGEQFLEMHDEMVRVLLFLSGIKPKQREWPLDWPMDDVDKMPDEIRSLFQRVRPGYLNQVFEEVKKRSSSRNADIDKLGIFIERRNGEKDGSGFHNTFHDYVGSWEGDFAKGAEMNKLGPSMHNRYFWSLHFWIDAHYRRALAGGKNNIAVPEPLNPKDAMCTARHKSHKATMSVHVM